jgi:hypothetical protein
MHACSKRRFFFHSPGTYHTLELSAIVWICHRCSQHFIPDVAKTFSTAKAI